MQAFVINLEGAADRWAFIEATFRETGCQVVRVPAVNGTAISLPDPGFAESKFQRFHGRTTNLREVGCYFSHVAACRMFLETSEPHALICEDDIEVGKAIAPVLESLLACASSWDLVRLSAIGDGHPAKVKTLGDGRALMVNFGRLKGTGAYLVNRKAAEAIAKEFLPMQVPFDHAIDREWAYGLRAFSVQPFPVSQTAAGFRTSIHRGGTSGKLSKASRWLTTYPYQAVNEVTRYIVRALSYSMARLRGLAGA